MHWSLLAPLTALALLVVMLWAPLSPLLAMLAAVGLVGSVLAAVHHAEVVAHRVGEPFGTLVLALAITAIEVALIVSLMLAGGPAKASLARDTVYATVMIISSGVVGICVFVGGLRHREQHFRIEGAGPAFAALVALATLVLVMPVFTKSAPGASYSTAQLVFVAISSLLLWLVFVFFQTVHQRDYFLPVSDPGNEEVHAPPPSRAQAAASLALLLVALVSVVGLAKALSPVIESVVRGAGLPPEVVGIVIAVIVLLPEAGSALRAALADRLQTSMNLALGSALASIGLTIPAVVVASIAFDVPLVLGLDAKEIALMALAFLVGTIALGTGRTSMMQGAVQLVIFAAFLFLALVP